MESSPEIVLLVEGDIVVRHPLAEYLRECGFVVLEAATGDEAMAILGDEATQVDAVLLDMLTPGSGFPLCNWIRAKDASIEIILGGTLERITDNAATLCEDGPALAKPYEHRFVLDRIRQAMARRRKPRP